ncbi:hypothetical protein LASA110932_08895 [Latilactobacillus sakei]
MQFFTGVHNGLLLALPIWGVLILMVSYWLY